MAAKKQLELTPTPFDETAENADGAESRYEKGDRRIELTTKSGSLRPEFSHETGTVTIDESGIEDFRKKHDAETAERAARTREFHHQEAEKLHAVMTDNSAAEQWNERLEVFLTIGRYALIWSVLYFGAMGLVELAHMATGRAAPSLAMYFLLAITAAIVFSLPYVPLKLARGIARLGYALTLIYLGVAGVLHLLDLYRHRPAARYAWSGFGYHIATVLATLAVVYAAYFAARFLWRRHRDLRLAFESPEAPVLQEYPALKNREHLRLAQYALEGAAIMVFCLTVTLIFFRDPITFAFVIARSPEIVLAFLYPFGVYLFFRSIFFPKI